MAKVISIHQPNYLPWLGYFHKMTYSDTFVFLDSVQYTPKSYTNRTQMVQNGAPVRLSIPVKVPQWDSAINEVEIDAKSFAAKHLKTMRHAYGKCRNFDSVMAVLEPHYGNGARSLAEFNMALCIDIATFIGLKAQFIKLSDLDLNSAKNQLLVDISKACGGDIFVSGIGARNYIEGQEAIYKDAGIALAYQNFVHPVYRQRTAPFVDGASIVDLLFNHGKDALDILTSQSTATYTVC